MTSREKLPNRRTGETLKFEHSGHTFHGRVGWYPDGRIGEVWLSTGKTGTQLAITMQDSAIAASLALQHGVPIDTLRQALLRAEDGGAAGPLGHLFDMLDGLEMPKPSAKAETRYPSPKFWNWFLTWGLK